MSMLIGVLCEVISQVSEEEKEIATIERVKDKFTGLLYDFDVNQDGAVSWDEFVDLVLTDECQLALKNLNVDVDALIDMAEAELHSENKGNESVTFNRFISLVLDLRGSQTACVKDIMALGRRIDSTLFDLTSSLEVLTSKIGAKRQSPLSYTTSADLDQHAGADLDDLVVNVLAAVDETAEVRERVSITQNTIYRQPTCRGADFFEAIIAFSPCWLTFEAI